MLASVVPRVMSCTCTPATSDRVKLLFTRRLPKIDSLRQYSSSTCSQAML